jgi:uncharacterized protein (DUF697 family)
MDRLEFSSVVDKALEKAILERGHVNMLVAGRTGAGVRTLVDATLQGHIATTGQDQPVRRTRRTRERKKEGVPLTVFETRGLEEENLDELRRFVEERERQPHDRDHIHVAWVCLRDDEREVRPAAAAATAMLAHFLPVLVVLTRASHDDGFQSEVKRLLPAARDVIRVRTLPERLPDGTHLDPLGLPELVEATAGLIPEHERHAFVAAEKSSLALKARTSHVIVGGSAAAAAGIAITPIPAVDIALMIPLLVGMLGAVTVTFGIPIGDGFLRTVAASTVGGTAAAFGVQAAVGEALKLAPEGAVAGGAIAATTAAAMTTTFGEAYIAVLEQLFREHPGTVPSADEVVTGLHHALGR